MKLVSVVIPVFNAGNLLRPAVESILSQTWETLEVIVVDDGSTDGAVENLRRVLDDDRIKVMRQENRGKACAVNRALDQVRGDYWTLQDADDLSYPERLARQVEALEEDASLAAVFVNNDIRIGDDIIAARCLGKTAEECAEDIRKMNLPAHDALGMYRREMLADMRFDEELRIGQGVDFVLRVGESHPIRVIPGCWYSHRVNPDSITHHRSDQVARYAGLLREKIYQRRGLPVDPEPTPAPGGRGGWVSRLFPHRSQDTIVSYAVDSMRHLRSSGQIGEALHTAFYCIRRHPFDPFYYKPLVRLLVPDSWTRRGGKPTSPAPRGGAL